VLAFSECSALHTGKIMYLLTYNLRVVVATIAFNLKSFSFSFERIMWSDNKLIACDTAISWSLMTKNLRRIFDNRHICWVVVDWAISSLKIWVSYSRILRQKFFLKTYNARFIIYDTNIRAIFLILLIICSIQLVPITLELCLHFYAILNCI